jgi:hypothetical protein
MLCLTHCYTQLVEIHFQKKHTKKNTNAISAS